MKAERNLIDKLNHDCPEHVVLDELNSHRRGQSRVSVAKSFSTAASWMILPFRPCWGQARIARAVQSCRSLFDNSGLSHYMPNVSWSNGGKHLWRLV